MAFIILSLSLCIWVALALVSAVCCRIYEPRSHHLGSSSGC